MTCPLLPATLAPLPAVLRGITYPPLTLSTAVPRSFSHEDCMSQPKNRRRAARKAARANAERGPRVGFHVDLTGEARNPIGKVSPLDRAICVGFGSAAVHRDGRLFVDGEDPKRRSLVTSDGYVTLRKVEKWIKRHRAGGSRWIASVHAPLWSATWERRRPGKWVCTEAGEGFA